MTGISYNLSGKLDSSLVEVEEGTLFKTINTYIHFSFKSGDRDFDGGRSWAFGDGGICPREGDSERRAGRKNLMFLINVPFFHDDFVKFRLQIFQIILQVFVLLHPCCQHDSLGGQNFRSDVSFHLNPIWDAHLNLT